MQIDPQYKLPLVYQINDPADDTTYYPQAVIRDSVSGDILSTQNLALASTRRYTGSWDATKDPTGQGRHIDITITVYTDANRTTVSPIHPVSIDKYLIRSTGKVSFGGGSDVNYEKIEKIVNARLVVFFNALVEKLPKEISLNGVVASLDKLPKAVVDALPKPKEVEKVDLSPVIKSISESEARLSKQIADKPVTEVDMTGFENEIREVREAVSGFDKLKESFAGLITDLKEAVGVIKEFISKVIEANERYTKKQEEIKTGIDALATELKTSPPPKKEDERITRLLNKKR